MLLLCSTPRIELDNDRNHLVHAEFATPLWKM